MKTSRRRADSTKNPPKTKNAPVSELEAQIHKAHPLVQNYISELKKEIRCLHQQNIRQDVAHFSALEKLKAEHAEQLKAKPMLTIVTAGDTHKTSKT